MMGVSTRFGLAACLGLMAAVATFARNPIPPRQAPAQQTPAQATPATPDLPVVNGGAGDCTADFTVNDPAGKGIYDAKIRIQVKYGFLGLHKIDAMVGTNYDGKARVIGLPLQIRGTADFTVSHGGDSKSLPYDPFNDCHSKHDVTLGAK